MGRRSMQGLVDASHLTVFAGVFEILLAFSLLIFWKKKFPLYITIVCMVLLTLGVLAFWPQLALQAFNPVTLNILVIVLSVVNLNQLKSFERKYETGD